MANTTVWGWGYGLNGQIGNNLTQNQSSPVSIRKFVKVVSRGVHSLALDSNGMIWAWGNNDSGQLGNNTQNPTSSPVSICRAGSYVDIATGVLNANQASFAIDSNGMIWAWGDNTVGQLGTGDENPQSSPVSIARSASYSQLAIGVYHVHAIDGATGMVYSWGGNNDCQLGIGTFGSAEPSPRSIARAGSYSNIFTETSVGYSASYAIEASTGMIWSWGLNYYGRLGDNATAHGDAQSSPVSIARAGSYTNITLGNYNTFALDSDGMVWSWGQNVNNAELGINAAGDRSSPTSIARSASYSSVSSKLYATLAIDGATGMVYSWGSNSDGQVGDNSITHRSSPVTIAHSASYKIISAAAPGSCYAIDSNGTIWAWGLGNNGALGINSTDSQSSPVSIAINKKFASINQSGSASEYPTLFGQEQATIISTFSAPTVVDGASVTSTIDTVGLVDAVQIAGTDTYFDTTAEVSRVDVYYTHQDGRQQVRLPHMAPAFTAGASWSSFTRDGTWSKSRVRAFDWEGAIVTLDGTNVPSGENLTHSDGTMNLNT